MERTVTEVVETLDVVMRDGTGKIKKDAEGGEIVPEGSLRDEMYGGSEKYWRPECPPCWRDQNGQGAENCRMLSLAR